MNKERRTELYYWVIDRLHARESIGSIQQAAIDLFQEHQLNSIEEMMFLTELACEIHHVKMSYLVVDKPDKTDIWRENLKAWNLKQREESNHIDLAAKYRFFGGLAGQPMEELFIDDLQKSDSHYKGEF